MDQQNINQEKSSLILVLSFQSLLNEWNLYVKNLIMQSKPYDAEEWKMEQERQFILFDKSGFSLASLS